jgi:hypothetical protein
VSSFDAGPSKVRISDTAKPTECLLRPESVSILLALILHARQLTPSGCLNVVKHPKDLPSIFIPIGHKKGP